MRRRQHRPHIWGSTGCDSFCKLLRVNVRGCYRRWSAWFLAGSWWFLAVLGRSLLFVGANSSIYVALLADTRNEFEKRFARFRLQMVPRTTTNASINLTQLQNSDPKSTIHLYKIINDSFGFDSGRMLAPGPPINEEDVDATWSILEPLWRPLDFEWVPKSSVFWKKHDNL